MANVRARPETGHLYIDFRFRGERCREQTALPDTMTNRRTLEAMAARIKREIARGKFDYAKFFPDSPRAKEFVDSDLKCASKSVEPIDKPPNHCGSPLPSFREFAELWFLENRPRWRKQHTDEMRKTLDRVVLPFFETKSIAVVDRASLLGFQAHIANRRGRGGQSLSAKRINKLMALVKAILNEACERFGLSSPARGLKRLKQRRAEIEPFSLEEMNLVIASVREDFRPYITLRMLTGVRTGEADGLQWDDIDFEANTLRIQRTVSRNGDGDTKTDGSRRTIPLVPQVLEALLKQRELCLPDCPWVFHTRNGQPLDAVNFTNRVWYPLLRHLGLKLRPPYQMRHTAATLMLAAGENPEWIAKLMGHANTEMLFRVYSRFVPNLTRNDGLAFSGLLSRRITNPKESDTQDGSLDLSKLTRAQLEAMVASLRDHTKETSHVV